MTVATLAGGDVAAATVVAAVVKRGEGRHVVGPLLPLLLLLPFLLLPLLPPSPLLLRRHRCCCCCCHCHSCCCCCSGAPTGTVAVATCAYMHTHALPLIGLVGVCLPCLDSCVWNLTVKDNQHFVLYCVLTFVSGAKRTCKPKNS